MRLQTLAQLSHWPNAIPKDINSKALLSPCWLWELVFPIMHPHPPPKNHILIEALAPSVKIFGKGAFATDLGLDEAVCDLYYWINKRRPENFALPHPHLAPCEDTGRKERHLQARKKVLTRKQPC